MFPLLAQAAGRYWWMLFLLMKDQIAEGFLLELVTGVTFQDG
jgi:hypothetical protein